MPPTQQQQIDALRMAVEALQARQDAADRVREDTHRRVQDMQGKQDAMFDALMRPQIGQGDRSLIERIASVTVEIESGKRAGQRIVFWAQVCAAIGVIAAFAYAAVNFGAPK